MKIAMIGTRGVPANYGGFETCVEEISTRLVNMGHDVTVYCRASSYPERLTSYKGISLIYLPCLQRKSLETLSHTFVAVLHALTQGFDVMLAFNSANAPLLFPLKLMGARIGLNTDGLEWKRAKWGTYGKLYYRIAEKIACLVANRLISDSQGIHDYYFENHYTDSSIIAYGAPQQYAMDASVLKNYGLTPGAYFLQITRFEPENRPLDTLRAFNQLNTEYKLILVGNNPYMSEYLQCIHREAGSRVLLPGTIYDKDILRELWCGCHAYIHGNSVGGTNPALLQAMGSGCYVIASDILFNREVLASCGVYYSKNVDDLRQRMQHSLEHAGELDSFRQAARQRVRDLYNWDIVAAGYAKVCEEIADGAYPFRLSLAPFKRFSIGASWSNL